MKEMIRKANKEKRRIMNREEVVKKSEAAAKVFLESKYYQNSKQIMLYMPLGNETDTTPIINAAFRDEKAVVFPVTNKENGTITPYYALADTGFIKGAFSVSEPVGTIIADMEKTDVILVPGIAFDRTGSRVGFGKGCYDRFLANSSSILIGFCYYFQICDTIPADIHDIKMDFLVTEKGIIRCKDSRIEINSF